jgi:hypothetical protein
MAFRMEQGTEPSPSSRKWANQPSAAKKPRATEEWWSVLLLAAGAVVGVVLATIRHLLHYHLDLTADEAL